MHTLSASESFLIVLVVVYDQFLLCYIINYSIVQFMLLCYAVSLYHGLDSVIPVIWFYSLTHSLKGSLNVTFHGFDFSQFFVWNAWVILLVSICDWLISTLMRMWWCTWISIVCILASSYSYCACYFSSCTWINFLCWSCYLHPKTAPIF